ncbi:MAG: hypothetical protein EBS42_06820, partial [Caulobacteraceae bacterium]|nr:hypothetical protein [Caulobacteraceae bacterium]
EGSSCFPGGQPVCQVMDLVAGNRLEQGGQSRCGYGQMALRVTLQSRAVSTRRPGQAASTVMAMAERTRG